MVCGEANTTRARRLSTMYRSLLSATSAKRAVGASWFCSVVVVLLNNSSAVCLSSSPFATAREWSFSAPICTARKRPQKTTAGSFATSSVRTKDRQCTADFDSSNGAAPRVLSGWSSFHRFCTSAQSSPRSPPVIAHSSNRSATDFRHFSKRVRAHLACCIQKPARSRFRTPTVPMCSRRSSLFKIRPSVNTASAALPSSASTSPMPV
mmetsp:Transcript_14517/g.36299  ORF Transcript_14517/g.36299 Transcript_14517/m.36299 type:complete len:208 (-) Transcript_14517:304-927(-)